MALGKLIYEIMKGCVFSGEFSCESEFNLPTIWVKVQRYIFRVQNDNLKDKGVAVILTIISYLFQSKYQ